MMRALFSGVSGLKSHQTRMDVIGNNIANVNTTGFKSKRLNFADMLYQTTQAGSASNTETQRGGINPRQIGLGVKTGAINTSITTEGANQSTGNPFDLKLTGEAFFIVSDGTNTYYTRDGSFDVDDAGYLVMANTGYTVMGWTLPDNAANDETATIVQGATVKPINVKQFTSYNPGSTTGAYFSGIIDKNDSNLLTDTGRQVNLQFYDKMGYEYNLKFGIKPVPVTETATREVTTQQFIYDYAGTTLSVNDKMNKTYKKYPGGDTTDAADAETHLSSGIADLDKKIEEVVNAAHLASKPGVAEPITITIQASADKKSLDIFVGDTPGGDPAASVPLDNADQSEWNGTKVVAEFDGEKGVYKNNADGSKSLLDIPVETMETLLGKTTTKYAHGDNITAADLGKIRVTTKSFTDEAGVDQVRRTVERSTDGGTTYTPIPDTVSYADLAALLSIVEPITFPSELTAETIDADGFQAGRFKLTLLGMTDSTGATVDISNLGDVTYDLVYNTDNGQFSYVGSEGNDTFTLNLNELNELGNFDALTIDMSDTKNVDNEGKCTLEGLRSNGRKDGKWTGVSIGTDGTVTVNYSNGMTRDIAQIAVATFGNAMGLENAGDNLYEESQSSGEASIVDIEASGTGYMTSGVLEMSNVDLAQEFTDMITTQRGFQANSRIITTSDSILEELVNLKR